MEDTGLEKKRGAILLRKKIENLPQSFLRDPRENRNKFKRWLGVVSIHNPERGVEEEVGDFLLRHTRFLPREVVEIGNAICSATHVKSKPDVDIWSLVIRQAELISNRALQVIYDHALSLSEDVFPSAKERKDYRLMIEAGFDAFFSAIESEVFSREILEFANALFKEACCDDDMDIDCGDLLWQHGLIGYLYCNEAHGYLNPVSIFYHAVGGAEGSASYRLPHAEEYRLHASLLKGARVRLDRAVPLIDSQDAVP